MFTDTAHLERVIEAIVAGTAFAIVVLGWVIGRIFPRARFIAPFVLVVIPACIVLGQDLAFQLVTLGPCVVAATAVTLYWLVRAGRTPNGRSAGTRPNSSSERP